MLVLCGILRAATTLGGTVNKKTGEVYPSPVSYTHLTLPTSDLV